MQCVSSTMPGSRYGEAAIVLARSFRCDPVIQAVLAGVDESRRIFALSAVFNTVLHRCGPRGFAIDVLEAGVLVGACMLHHPLCYPPPLLDQLCIIGKGITTLWSPSALGRWMKLMSAFEARHPREPHCYLEFIGVDPQVQGRGVGSTLLEQVTRLLDQQQIGCHLETGNPRNVPLYKRFGFEITSEERVLGVKIWFMWRPASTRGPA